MIALWKDERRRAMLTALVLLSVAACSDDGAEGATDGTLAAPKQVVNAKSGDDASTGTADRARPVRIGTAGSDSGRCEAIGRVGNLPGGDDNFLAVREGPTPRTRELARLDSGARVYLCDRNADGKWLGVVYRTTGGLPEGDGCALQAAEGGIYDGPCHSGWVSARYVMRERHVMEGSGEEIATPMPSRPPEPSTDLPTFEESLRYIRDRCLGVRDDERSLNPHERATTKGIDAPDPPHRFAFTTSSPAYPNQYEDRRMGTYEFDLREVDIFTSGNTVGFSCQDKCISYVSNSLKDGAPVRGRHYSHNRYRTYREMRGTTVRAKFACRDIARVRKAVDHLQALAGGRNRDLFE